MTMLGGEITVTRGETFSLNFNIVNRDGTPFIVSKELRNPYIQISIVSSRYEQEGRYERSWWLDLDKGYRVNDEEALEEITLRRFLATTPITITALTDTAAQAAIPDVSHLNDFVYKYRDKFYYRNDINEYREYAFKLLKTFNAHDVMDFVDMDYLYDIKMVSGQTLLGYTVGRLAENDVNYDEDVTIEEAMELLKPVDHNEYKRIKSFYKRGRPLMDPFDTKQIILTPKKLTVMSTVIGGL